MARAGIARQRGGPPGGQQGGGRSGSLIWLQGLACGALVTLATPTAVLCFLLLVPALVAALFETSVGRLSARPVLLWGVAASARPMVALWTDGHTTAHALALAGDIRVIATAWSAQAGGWLVAELLPLLIAAGFKAASATQAARLRAARARYEAEWEISPPANPES